LYLRALAQFNRSTDKNVREAIVLLKRALAIDSSYAPAAALIGHCRFYQSNHWVSDPVSDADVADSVRLARHTIAVGKDDPDALSKAAFVLTVFAGEHSTAASVIERALALNPNSAHGWIVSGFVSCFRGQPGPAIEALQRAMRLSPRDPLGAGLKGNLAAAHLVAGRYEEALDWADRSLHEQPRLTPSLRVKVVSLVQIGRLEEARECLRSLLELQPGLTIALYRRYLARFCSNRNSSSLCGGLPQGRIAGGMTAVRSLAAAGDRNIG
jgi:adenylate cyclase